MDILKLIPVLLACGLLVACGGDSGRTLPKPPVPPAASSSSEASSASSLTSSAAAVSSSSAASSAPALPDFDFEADTLGEPPVGLDVNPEAPSHALVSNEQAFNGSHALKLVKPTAGQNAYGRFVMDEPVASGSLQVAVYVSADANGQTLVTLFGGDWAGATNRLIDVVFNIDGNLRVRPPGGNPANTGTTFTLGAWHLLDITWNDIGVSNEFSVHLNGALVGTYPVAIAAGLEPDRLELKYGQSGASAYLGAAYFDDIYLPLLSDAGGSSSSADSSASEASSSSEAASSSSEEDSSSSEADSSSSEADSSSSEADSSSSAAESSSSSAGPAPDFDFEADSLGVAPTGFDVVQGTVVVISNEQANTGFQSLKMSNTENEPVRVRKLQTAATSGSLQVAVYIPAGVGIQSFVTLYDGGYAGGDRAIDIIFAGNGPRDLRSRLGGSTPNVGIYNENAWNLLEISWTDIDTSNEFTLSLNGALLGTYGVVTNGKVPDRLELKYGQNDAAISTESIYFDDIVLGF